MSFERAEKIADAVLLEGYALYPYRATSAKNQYRWTFGVVAPRGFSEASGGSDPWRRSVQALLSGANCKVRGRLRFLQVVERRVELERDGRFEPTGVLNVGSEAVRPWEEGVLRELDFSLEPEPEGVTEVPIHFEPRREEELVTDETGAVGRIVREHRELLGRLRVQASAVNAPAELYRLTLEVENTADIGAPASRAEAMSSSFVSLHLVLAVEQGRFISTLDPPDDALEAASACSADGLYPVLAGPPGDHDLLLCSPIILPDHPAIAPESPGDFYDAGEIDELLTLRTLTLTPDEKREARALDARTRSLLDRVDALEPETMARLHGAVREFERPALYAPGSRLRLRPGVRRTDAQDLLFAGRIATVEAVLTDVDGQEVIAVTVDDDPAQELHRWYRRYQYYYPDEVEPVDAGKSPPG